MKDWFELIGPVVAFLLIFDRLLSLLSFFFFLASLKTGKLCYLASVVIEFLEMASNVSIFAKPSLDWLIANPQKASPHNSFFPHLSRIFLQNYKVR